MELSGNLPAGFSVATGGAGQRAIGAGLEGGSTLAAGGAWQTVFGSYSSPKVTILVADGSSAGFGPGEVARLTCQLAPGADTSDNARIAIAGGLAFQASGIDPTALVQPSPLTSYLRSGVSISYLP